MLFSSLRSCPPSPLSLLVLCICSLVCPSRAPDQKTSATCRRNRGGRNCKANWTTSTRTFRKRWTRGIIENKYSLTTKSEDRTDLSAASSQGRSHQDERRVHKESSDGRPCQRGPPVNRNRPEYREAPVWSSKIWGEFCVLASRERKSWENHKFQPRCAAPLAQPPILGEEVMQPDTCLHAQSCDTLLHPFTSAQLRFFLWKSSCLRMSFFFFLVGSGLVSGGGGADAVQERRAPTERSLWDSEQHDGEQQLRPGQGEVWYAPNNRPHTHCGGHHARSRYVHCVCVGLWAARTAATQRSRIQRLRSKPSSIPHPPRQTLTTSLMTKSPCPLLEPAKPCTHLKV